MGVIRPHSLLLILRLFLRILFQPFMIFLFREEEAIQLEGLSVKEMKELRDKAEKHTFQAEVDRMMKLIINSLYKNKEVSSQGHARNRHLNNPNESIYPCIFTVIA